MRELTAPSLTRETQIVYCGYRGWRGVSKLQEHVETQAREAVKAGDKSFLVIIKTGWT